MPDDPTLLPDEPFRAATATYVDHLARTESFCHVAQSAVPSPRAVARLIERARRVLFPGYYGTTSLPVRRLEFHVEVGIARLYAETTALVAAALRHERLGTGATDASLLADGREVAGALIAALPRLKDTLDSDVRAAYEGDPAAKSCTEIILSYPGLHAMTVYRVAHVLHGLGVPLLPRMMTEHAHNRTGIDIHPGAQIGRSFFMDHGTGVVIGETTEIGDRVRIYQGVTLGALSLPRDAGVRFRNTKRHPTIEDDVIIYANTTILGGTTIIGARSIIGGNNWITESVPPDTRVLSQRPELTYASTLPRVHQEIHP